MRKAVFGIASALFWCMIIAWALRAGGMRRSRKEREAREAVKTIHHTQFRKEVRDGDLLATRASNNVMSLFHASGLDTPIAHVGIAVVERQGDVSGRVYMFEAGAPRGAQLRDLDEYMSDGAEQLWWRPLKATAAQRALVMQAIAKLSGVAYSWAFLKSLPREVMGFDAPGAAADTDTPCSCAELIARAYAKSGIAMQSRPAWLPMHFLGPLPSHEPPINVIFEGLAGIKESRERANRDRLADAIVASALQVEAQARFRVEK